MSVRKFVFAVAVFCVLLALGGASFAEDKALRDISAKVDLVYDAFAAGRERHKLEIEGVKVCVKAQDLYGLNMAPFIVALRTMEEEKGSLLG